MFDHGDEVEFHYPIRTHVKWIDSTEFRSRQVIVRSVRDLVERPLTPDEFLRRPYVRRSRWLVRGIENDSQQFRQFYTGVTPQFAAPSQLRVGLYEPDGVRPVQLLGRGFEPTIKDRRILIRALDRWLSHDYGELLIRIFSDDLRLV